MILQVEYAGGDWSFFDASEAELRDDGASIWLRAFDDDSRLRIDVSHCNIGSVVVRADDGTILKQQTFGGACDGQGQGPKRE